MKSFLLLFLLLLLFPLLLNAQTITYSGTNVGIGSTSPGTTLDVQGTVRALGYTNSLSFITSATPSAASSFTISGLTPGVNYVLYFNLTQNTSVGALEVQFNGDTGSNYQSISSGYSASAQFRQQNSTGTTFGWLSTGDLATGTGIGSIYFTSSGNNGVLLNGLVSIFNNNSYVDELESAVKYTGSSGLSSITILTSSGTITGNAWLYAIQ